MSNQQPPRTIYIQWHGDGDPDDGDVSIGDVTWCKDRIFDNDVEYIRADVVEQIRLRERERTANMAADLACEAGLDGVSLKAAILREMAQEYGNSDALQDALHRCRAETLREAAGLCCKPIPWSQVVQKLRRMADEAEKGGDATWGQ